MRKKNGVKSVAEVTNIAELIAMRHSKNINKVHEENLTPGDRIADRMAGFAGSWGFILSFMGSLLIWIALNSIQLLFHPFDPFPFILLNLVLSCVAAMQAPVIMMSQNRQGEKDRIRAEHDYEINLKSEILIEEIIKRLNRLEETHAVQMKNQEKILESILKRDK